LVCQILESRDRKTTEVLERLARCPRKAGIGKSAKYVIPERGGPARRGVWQVPPLGEGL
jgi:hypothetical protein